MAAPHESAPRCRVGIRTDNQCLRTATVRLQFDGPPEICEHHDRLWNLDAELGQTEEAQRMLTLWQEQAEMFGCPPLEDAIRFVRAEADLEVTRLKREVAVLEEAEHDTVDTHHSCLGRAPE
jgi:hypothetical protein